MGRILLVLWRLLVLVMKRWLVLTRLKILLQLNQLQNAVQLLVVLAVAILGGHHTQ